MITGREAPDQCTVKISDFGLSKCLNPEAITSGTSSDVGTLAFKAPEFHDSRPHYHKNVDVFAEGLTFLAMITAREGHSLIPTVSASNQLGGSRHIGLEMHLRNRHNLSALDVAPNEPDDDPLTRGVKEMIRRMTRLEPEERPLAEEVYQFLINEHKLIQLGQVSKYYAF